MKRLLLVAALLVAMVLPVAHAAAFDPFGSFKDQSVCQSDTTPSPVCTTDGKNNISGTNGILRKVANLISLLAGITSVILIMIAGFQFVTSGGDANKAASARSMLIGAIIGVVIVVFSQAILQFVLKSV